MLDLPKELDLVASHSPGSAASLPINFRSYPVFWYGREDEKPKVNE